MIFVEIDELLNEYTQNKVRANARLRYQENGKIPVTISGTCPKWMSCTSILDQASQTGTARTEESTATTQMLKRRFTSLKDNWSRYPAKSAVRTSYSTNIAVFECEIEGLSLPTLPIVPAQEVRGEHRPGILHNGLHRYGGHHRPPERASY